MNMSGKQKISVTYADQKFDDQFLFYSLCFFVFRWDFRVGKKKCFVDRFSYEETNAGRW